MAGAYYLTVSGGSGSGYHNLGSNVPISAYVPAGYAFSHWGGLNAGSVHDVNAANTYITVSGPQSITAIFTHVLYYVNYRANAGGSISSGGSQSAYYGNYLAPATAAADPGYHFTGWNDGNQNLTRQDVCYGNYTYTASFEANTPPGPDGSTLPGNIIWM